MRPNPEGHEFEDFFRRQYRSLLAYVGRRTASTADAEEIAQESCIRLLGYGALATRPERVWKALLYRIAGNLAVDHYRALGRRPVCVHEEIQEDSLVGSAPLPCDLATASELNRAVHETLLELSPRTRRIFLLSRAHGKSYAEIAAICEVSVKAVEKHVSRALRSLKQTMEERT